MNRNAGCQDATRLRGSWPAAAPHRYWRGSRLHVWQRLPVPRCPRAPETRPPRPRLRPTSPNERSGRSATAPWRRPRGDEMRSRRGDGPCGRPARGRRPWRRRSVLVVLRRPSVQASSPCFPSRYRCRNKIFARAAQVLALTARIWPLGARRLSRPTIRQRMRRRRLLLAVIGTGSAGCCSHTARGAAPDLHHGGRGRQLSARHLCPKVRLTRQRRERPPSVGRNIANCRGSHGHERDPSL
jgi:hypothetical protein